MEKAELGSAILKEWQEALSFGRLDLLAIILNVAAGDS